MATVPTANGGRPRDDEPAEARRYDGATPRSTSPSPAPSRRRVPSGPLLDAARSVFARHGFEHASMDAVAAEAGTTKPTLYARFGSKRDLYEATVRRDADDLVNHLFAAYSEVADAPVAAMVEASMAAWFAFFDDRPDAFALLFASGRAEPASAVADAVIERVTRRLAEMVGSVLARDGRVDPEAAWMIAAMLLGIADHGVAAVRRRPGADPRRARALATAMALAALRGLPPELLREPGA